MSVPGYTAPADRPLTVLHIRNPDVKGCEGTPDRAASSGVTLCGLELRNEELWQLVDLMPGDSVCPQCRGGPAPSEAVLW